MWFPEAPPRRCNLISRGCVVFGQHHGSYNAGFLLKPFFHDLHLTRSKCNQDFSPLFGRFAKSNYEIERNLSGSDCKYRESADKLRKSKILITCQKNTFGELSSKILLKPSGILLFSGNSEKRFCLIYYAIIRLKIKQIENACFTTVCNARKQF